MIDVNNLSISYDSREVLKDVSFRLPDKGIFAIVGPSGSGKSSLLSALNRMTDHISGASVSGSVLVEGEEIINAPVDLVRLRKRVGMIFQKANPFPMSIRKNIQLAMREHGEKNRNVLEQKTESVLKAVGLWDEVGNRLDQNALVLSGGQQQRLCLARALVLEPQALLLDEPCSALDPLAGARIEELLLELASTYPMLLVTHNLAQARRLATNVGVIWNVDGVGKLIEHGPAETVFHRPKDPLVSQYFSGTCG